ncbi:MAG: YdcF family protein [Syntrophothermus sp.]
MLKALKLFFLTAGMISTLLILLAFTALPFYAWYRLSMSKAGITRQPEVIVVMGGGGMPSESGLMRTWYAAELAKTFDSARIIIALPGNAKDTMSSVNLMKKELVEHGIREERIFLEDSGTNTRSQALMILQNLKNKGKLPSLVIVTAPEHLYRAVKVFRKVGFIKTDGIPTFEEAIEANITYHGKKIGRKFWVPEVGDNLTVRYNFWTQLRYEQLLMREYAAIAYYWLNGWI